MWIRLKPVQMKNWNFIKAWPTNQPGATWFILDAPKITFSTTLTNASLVFLGSANWAKGSIAHFDKRWNITSNISFLKIHHLCAYKHHHYQYQNCSLDLVFWYTPYIQYSFWITNLWLTTWPLSSVCLHWKVRARFQLRVESWLHCTGTFRPWSTSNDMFGSPLADPWLENLRESSVFTPLSLRTSSANWEMRLIQYSLVGL